MPFTNTIFIQCIISTVIFNKCDVRFTRMIYQVPMIA